MQNSLRTQNEKIKNRTLVAVIWDTRLTRNKF